MTEPPAEGHDVLAFCIPVFNDWSAVTQVLVLLDRAAPQLGMRAQDGSVRALRLQVLLVDDGSTDAVPPRFDAPLPNIERIDVLPLRRNLGHQRAIAIGLTWLYVNRKSRAVIVMDADGQDAPDQIPLLLAELELGATPRVVFAARGRRSEGLVFRTAYQAFKLVHLILTGKKVEVGNFSVLPASLLERLVGVSELWNHYAAAVFKARLPVAQVSMPRGPRLDGDSKMSFVSLVTHGLSAISVYGETVGVRLLGITVIGIAAIVTAILGAVAVRLFTDLAIPGWATTAVGILSVLLVSSSLVLAVAVLFVLQSRDRYSFVPLRDYVHYALPLRTLHALKS